jgi:hypothetical protein
MREHNVRLKRRVPCGACGRDLDLIAYVDGRVDGRCEHCDTTIMVAQQGSLAKFIAPARDDRE